MKIPKPGLNLSDKKVMLVLVAIFGMIAPLYYAAIRPSTTNSSSIQPIEAASEPKAHLEDEPQKQKENPPQSSAIENGNTATPKPKKSDKTATSFGAVQTPSSTAAKPSHCTALNQKYGDKYLQEVKSISTERNRLYNIIASITGLLSINKDKEIKLLNDETYLKKLAAYNMYISKVRQAGCDPSGYSAP